MAKKELAFNLKSRLRTYLRSQNQAILHLSNPIILMMEWKILLSAKYVPCSILPQILLVMLVSAISSDALMIIPYLI